MKNKIYNEKIKKSKFEMEILYKIKDVKLNLIWNQVKLKTFSN